MKDNKYSQQIKLIREKLQKEIDNKQIKHIYELSVKYSKDYFESVFESQY